MSTADKELIVTAKALYESRKYSGDARPWPIIAKLVEALEAPHRVVESVEELDALPDMAVIIDRYGDVLQYRDGLWCGYESRPFGSEWVWRKFAPLTLIFRPEGDVDDEATA